VDSLPAAGTIRAKKKNPEAGSARAFDVNPGSWKFLIFILLSVINDKIRITKDGWPWD